jgi:hypothetical protein
MRATACPTCPPAVPAGTTELRLATVQKQGETVLFTLAGQLSSADQLLKVRVPTLGSFMHSRQQLGVHASMMHSD